MICKCQELADLVGPEDFCPYTGALSLTLWRGLAEFTVIECRFCLFCGGKLAYSPSPQPSPARGEGGKEGLTPRRQDAKTPKVKSPEGSQPERVAAESVTSFSPPTPPPLLPKPRQTQAGSLCHQWGKGLSGGVKKKLLEELARYQGSKISRGEVYRLAAAYNVPIEEIRQAVKRLGREVFHAKALRR